MFGALLTRALVPRSFQAQSRRDLDEMSRTWADDVVMEWSGPSVLAGRFEGREAVADAFRRDWDHLEETTIRPVHIALARPYAFGFTNTVFIEFVADVRTKDGRAGRVEGVSVVAMRRGKTVSIRNHYFDPTTIDAIWGPLRTDTAPPAQAGVA